MQISISLVALTGSFETDMNRASKTAQKRMREIEQTAKQVGKAIGVALVAGATAATLALKSAIDYADQLNDISKQVGIPTDVLSGLDYAAKLSGVATEQLQGGLVKMIKFQAEAAKGAKENVKIFKALGIEIKDSAGNLRAAKDVFGDLAEVFHSLQDGPEKTSLATAIFGKSGAELIPLLDEGRAGIKAMTDELDRLGGTVTPETARNADAFNDNLDKLKTAVGGLALQVASDLLPDMIDLTNAFVDNVTAGDGVSKTAHEIAEAIREIATAAVWTGDKIQKLAFYMGELNKVNPTYLLGRAGAGIFNPGVNPLQNPFSDPSAGGASASGQPAGFGKGIRGGGGKGFSFSPARKGFADLYGGGLFSPTAAGGGGAKKQVDEVAEAYKRMNAQMAEQIALFGQTSEVAKVRYDLEHGELAKLSAEKKQVLLDQAAEIDLLKKRSDAEEEAEKASRERQEVIDQAREALHDTLADMQFELDMLGKTNAERITENELRRIGIGLSEEERAAAREAINAKAQELESLHRQIDAMDELRQSFEDIFIDVATGQKSLIDGLKAFADAFVAQLIRMAAAQASTALFGEPGTTGGGWVGNLFGAIFGKVPGFAEGTNYAPGGWAWVGEKGPELVNLPKGSQVVPSSQSRRMAGGGDSFYFSDTYQAPVDARTREQVAKDKARQLQLAKARG